ncbi:hypothetical protein K440DRAFT_147244 [Wilcoxina mikolae CBS 423.85]|nr:hypothetical protein K440DRAFT_147244 [Wilcoxina mikolae CBS 423.85]
MLACITWDLLSKKLGARAHDHAVLGEGGLGFAYRRFFLLCCCIYLVCSCPFLQSSVYYRSKVYYWKSNYF